jgi:protein gp37
MANRLKAMGNPNYTNAFNLTLHPRSLSIPLKWKKPHLIFVNSMSDLFHHDVPLAFIKEIFFVMNNASQHTFQILTKRSKRLAKLAPDLCWSPNIWMGVSVENNDYTYRISNLSTTDAKIKFVSFEPLLGPITFVPTKGIDWMIVGGESGPKARPMQESWVVHIRNQCVDNGVPFFFKQWGGVNKKKRGRILEEKIWDEMPAR